MPPASAGCSTSSRDREQPGADILDRFTRDEMAAGLLLLHDLHPVDLETRVKQALDKVRPLLKSHGGDVEMLSLDGGFLRLRLQGSCHGCPSSAMTLKNAIEESTVRVGPRSERPGSPGRGVRRAADLRRIYPAGNCRIQALMRQQMRGNAHVDGIMRERPEPVTCRAAQSAVHGA